MTSLLVCCEIAGNSKSFSDMKLTRIMVFFAAPNCLNNSKSKVSAFKFPANSKLRLG